MARSSPAGPSLATVTEKVIRTEERPPTQVLVASPSMVQPEPTEDLWGYMASLTSEDWKLHRVYLYRYPLGQTKPRALGRYVRAYKTDCPLVSEEQIIDEFGGGQFDVMVQRKNEDGKMILVARSSFEIEGKEKYPWQESAAGQTQNSDLAQTLQVVMTNLQKAQASPNPSESPALKESVAMLKEVAAAMPKPEGVGALVTALGSLKELTGESSGGGNNLLETVKTLKELGIIGAPQDPMGQLKTMLEMLALMRGEVGGGGGGGRRDWGSTLIEAVPTILEKATPIVDRIADTARNNARIAELRAGRIPQAAPAVIDQPPQPEASATPRRPSNAEPRNVAPLETEPMNAVPKSDQRIAPNMEWVKHKVVEMFVGGKTGDLVAEFLDNLEPSLVNQLSALTSDQLMGFFRSDTVLRQIAESPRCAAFVAEFREYSTGEPAGSEPLEN